VGSGSLKKLGSYDQGVVATGNHPMYVIDLPLGGPAMASAADLGVGGTRILAGGRRRREGPGAQLGLEYLAPRLNIPKVLLTRDRKLRG